MFIITVLSEEPTGGYKYNADEIHRKMMTDDWSGIVEQYPEITLDAKQAAQELIAQGSEPEFFSITKDGNDVWEDDPPKPVKASVTDELEHISNVPDFIGDYIRNH
jgi:hypothetical protein